MGNRLLILFVFVFAAFTCSAQLSYKKYIKNFQKEYVKQHEVVNTKKDKKYFRFFPADEKYKVSANFIPLQDTVGFMMPTSSKKAKKFLRY